jgi:competence protein ComEC
MKPSKTLSENPLLWLSLSLAFGILLESYLGLGFWIWFISSLLSSLVLLLLINTKYASLILMIAFSLAGATLYNAEKSSIPENRLRRLYDEGTFKSGDPIEIEGILVRREKAFDGVFIGLEAKRAIYKQESREVSGFIRLFLPLQTQEAIEDYQNLALEYGTYLRVFCRLKRDDNFRNPGVTPSRKILDSKGVDATATIKSPLLIEKEDEKTWNPVFTVFKAREWMIEQFLEIFSIKTAGIMIASLLGNDNFLEKGVEKAFLEGGTFHLLVISGLQVTFIGGLVIFLLKLLTKNRILQFLLPTLFIWLYALAVGIYEKPVVRASLMLTIILFGKLIFRETSLLNLLSASTLILLVLTPSDLFDPSFQLTSLCVMAIASTSVPLLEKMRKIGQWKPSEETPAPPNCSASTCLLCESLYWSEEKWQIEQAQNVWSCRLLKAEIAKKLEKAYLQKFLRFLFEIFVVSIAIQIWLLPLFVFYFHRISFVGLFLNLWTGTLMSIESLTAIISVILYQISHALAMPFILLTEVLNQVILLPTDWFIKRDFSSIRLPHYSGLMSLVYFAYFIPIISLSYLIYTWNPFENKMKNEKLSQSMAGKRKLLIASLACLSVLVFMIIFHPFNRPQADNLLYVEFLDVGQGDSIFMKMPTGETFLIDGGGRPNLKKISPDGEIIEPNIQGIGETVVSRFLWQKGYSEIDFLVSTHADTDHIQGLTDVAKNFRIKTAFFGRMQFDNEEFSQLYEILKKQKARIYSLSKGDLLNFGDVKVLVLHPDETTDFVEKESVVSNNNYSLVFRVTYKNIAFLLTSDIEKEAEAELLRFPEILSANVVKVPHHGSKTSSTEDFIKATKAEYAVISVGEDSPFEHPDEDVVERWKKQGAKVLVTGDNGAIQFISDGKNLEIRTFTQTVSFR